MVKSIGRCLLVQNLFRFRRNFTLFVRKSECWFVINQIIYHCFSFFAVIAIAVLFLAATVFVYAYFKELRNNVNGKALLCFLVPLLVTYMFIPTKSLDKDYYYIHILTSSFIICSLVVSFLWMNIFIFDIWWIFR